VTFSGNRMVRLSMPSRTCGPSTKVSSMVFLRTRAIGTLERRDYGWIYAHISTYAAAFRVGDSSEASGRTGSGFRECRRLFLVDSKMQEPRDHGTIQVCGDDIVQQN
jgi:hypothetical protein